MASPPFESLRNVLAAMPAGTLVPRDWVLEQLSDCLPGVLAVETPAPPACLDLTIRDLATTQPAYYLDQPPAATVRTLQFQPLWDACEQIARSSYEAAARLLETDRFREASPPLSASPA